MTLERDELTRYRQELELRLRRVQDAFIKETRRSSFFICTVGEELMEKAQ